MPVEPNEEMKMTDVFTKRAIGHAEARECALRFIDGHFHNHGKEGPRVTIPARSDYDDDLVLLSYVKQQEAAAAPKPTIPADDREEVARAIAKSEGFDEWSPQKDYSHILDTADAAIRTLISLGWRRG